MRTEKLPTGELQGDALVTRTGVFTYRNADGSLRRELRHPDDVFRADSLASLRLRTITLGHPAEAVTVANARALGVGKLGDGVGRQDGFVRAPFVIDDVNAIAEIESGRKRELSCGYDCRLDAESGVYNGEAYDVRQRDIRYNHVAILPRGRAGPEVSIRLDADDAICIDSDAPARTNPTHADGAQEQPMTMIKINLDGADLEVPAASVAAFTAYDLTRKAASAELKRDLDKATARADAAEAELVKVKATGAPEAIAAAVKARVALEALARPHLGAEFKLDGLDDNAVRAAVISKLQPTADLAGKSADYVSARFDAALEATATATTAATTSAAAVRGAAARTDGVQPDDVKARHAAMVARNHAMFTDASKPAAKA